MSRRVAVVGAGISGLSCAWALMSSGVDVTLYESRARTGGHFLEVPIELDGQTYRINQGVGGALHNYIHMFAMCEHFDVELPSSPFQLFVQGRRGCWGQTTDARLCRRDDPHWRGLQAEIRRFTDQMHRIYATNQVFSVSCEIREFVKAHGYSETFVEDFLYPVMSLMLELSTVEQTLSHSMAFLPEVFQQLCDDAFCGIDFRHNMGALVEPLVEELSSRTHLARPVTRVRRVEGGVELSDGSGEVERYTDVVLTMGFDLVQRLLVDQEPEERNLLATFQARDEYAVLHGDLDVLPPSRPSGQIFGYYVDVERGLATEDIGQFEMGLPNRLLRTVLVEPPAGQIAANEILHVEHWRRELVTTDSLLMKSWLHRIQGRGGVWYCGAPTTLVSFDACMVSGLVVAQALGAEYPFEYSPLALALFDKQRRFMLEGGVAPSVYFNTPVG